MNVHSLLQILHLRLKSAFRGAITVEYKGVGHHVLRTLLTVLFTFGQDVWLSPKVT